MSKKDRIEKNIDLLKYWLSVFVISEIGIISWLVSNFKKGHPLYFLGVCIFIILIGIIYFIHKKIVKEIKKLEDI